ncbi:hypothetical protein Asp14428_71750 [Actinoplanes sp. NBRC 14428]|nr:hypothetical protein Asp14428_71750 [Actinoplanes sp. NBRC 14428]
MYETDVHSGPHAIPSRPRPVKTLAILLGVFGVLGLLIAFVLMAAINDSSGHGQSVPILLYVLFFVQFALSTAQTASGVFLWRGRSWARTLAIALCSVNIVGGLVSLATGAIFQAVAGIAINIGLIRLANNDEVQAWCGR